jgi:1-phosphatidylinositol-3-phosphate 5-kinase
MPDDRFLAKELSKAELNAMETFAPAYFDYIGTAVATGVSTVSSYLPLHLK